MSGTANEANLILVPDKVPIARGGGNTPNFQQQGVTGNATQRTTKTTNHKNTQDNKAFKGVTAKMVI